MIRDKLNMAGFSHTVALIGMLVVVGITGSFMAVASYAYYKNPQCDGLVKKYKITGGNGTYNTGKDVSAIDTKHFLTWCTKKQANNKSGNLSVDNGPNRGVWQYDYSQDKLLKIANRA